MVEEKKENKFVEIMNKYINLNGLFLAGKYLLTLVVMLLVISFLINWFITTPSSIKENKTFVIFFMMAVMLIPMYYSGKFLEEMEIEKNLILLLILLTLIFGGLLIYLEFI